MPVKRTNKIEIVFSNPLSIDLQVEMLSLVGELKEHVNNEPRFMINMFTNLSQLKTKEEEPQVESVEEIDAFRVNIPAHCPNCRVELGFVYNTLDEFKLVGYELKSSLRIINEIMFNEISSPKADANSNNSSSRLNSVMNKPTTSTTSETDLVPVLSSYDIKMIPNLPVIKSIELFSLPDLNQNRQCVSQLINSKFLAVPSKLGIW